MKHMFILLAAACAAHGAELLPNGKSVEVKSRTFAVPDTAVEPGKRMKLTCTARIIEGPSVESRPVLEENMTRGVWAPKEHGCELPKLHFEYRTADGKRRRDELYSVRGRWIYSSGAKDYSLEFYVPEGAAKLRGLISAPRGTTVEVASLKLEPSSGETLNVNPELELFNPSGIGYAHKAIFAEDGNRQRSIDVGTSWAMGDYIPVTPGDKLSIRFSGASCPDRPGLRVSVTYLKDCNFGKESEIGRNKMPIRLTGKQTTFTGETIVPPGAKWMRLSFSFGALEKIHITKVK